MGEIFEFPGKPSKEKKNAEPKETRSDESIPTNPDNQIKNVGEMDGGTALLQLLRMREYLERLWQGDPNSVNHNNAIRIAETFKNTSDVALFNDVVNTTEHDWNKNPAYYWAIIRVLTDRGLLSRDQR